MNIGTRITVGFVINERILEGANYDAGEIGHMVIDYHSSVEYPCGRNGCVEVLAYGLGMHNRATALLDKYPNFIINTSIEERISSKELFDGYEEKDILCQLVVNDALDAVDTTIINLIRVTNPKVIVLGGIVNDDWFIEHLLPKMNSKTIRFITEGIKCTQLEPSAIGLRGASLLVSQHLDEEYKNNKKRR